MSGRAVSISDRVRIVIPDRRIHQLIVWGALLIGWEVYGNIVGDFFVAPFSQTVVAFVDLFATGYIWEPLLGSLRQWLIGFLLALAVALPTGLMMGRIDSVKYFLDSYVNLMFVTSVSSMLPLLIIIFGTELKFRVTIVFLFGVFHMILSFQSGAENISEELIKTGRSLEASGAKLYRHVIFPASIPMIIAGMRLGIGRAFKGMVVAELWIQSGIGELLYGYQLYHQTDYLLAVVLILMLLAIISVQGLYWLETTMAPWRETSHR